MITQAYILGRFTYKDGNLYWNRCAQRSNQWNARFAGKAAGTIRKDGRTVIRIDEKLYLQARLIWLYFTGEFPLEIDHKDRDTTNDRFENLRAADRFVNNANTKSTGVTRARGKFIARIFRRGKQHSLGSFSSFDEAHKAYLKAKETMDS